MDAIYSPVRKVNYTVGRARIGQQTNYDRLIAGDLDRRHDDAGSSRCVNRPSCWCAI